MKKLIISSLIVLCLVQWGITEDTATYIRNDPYHDIIIKKLIAKYKNYSIEAIKYNNQNEGHSIFKYWVRDIDTSVADANKLYTVEWDRTIPDKDRIFIGSEAKSPTGIGYIAGTGVVFFSSVKTAKRFIDNYINTSCIKIHHRYDTVKQDDGTIVERCMVCGSLGDRLGVDMRQLEYFYGDIGKDASYYQIKRFRKSSQCKN